MPTSEQRPPRPLFWSLSLALLLSSPLVSAPSPPPPFRKAGHASAARPRLSLEDVVAFSDTTANGVRRQGIDTALRKYAFMALSHARTGIIYDVPLPPFLDGIICQAMRVRAGSARKRGLVFNEFAIPQGIVVQTGGPFVIMVYRKIVNFTLYSAPPGYELASPVVGIVIYTNLNTTLDNSPLPEMTVSSPNSSIVATLPISYNSLGISRNNHSVRFGCAYYDINGTASFTNISTYPNICSFKVLTDVVIIAPLSAVSVVSPPPGSPAVGMPPPPPPPRSVASKSSSSNAWKIILLAAVGGVVGIALLIAIIMTETRVGEQCQSKGANEPPDDEEALQTSLIGHTRAPTAAGVRTKPVLETGSLHT